MPDLATALDANRAAIDAFVQEAGAAAPRWTVAPRPGAWTPSQVTEHVARSYEEAAELVAGRTSVFPTIPAPFRPLARVLFFRRVLKRGGFPKSRTFKGLDPPEGPATAEGARARLEEGWARFEAASRDRESRGLAVDHGVFGATPVADYARFMEIHTRHHQRQLAV